jgi:hypothetical protein
MKLSSGPARKRLARWQPIRRAISRLGVQMSHITASQFKNRFVSLIMGGRDLPKKRVDRHILFISSILGLEPHRQYTESELNDELGKWTTLFGGNFNLDHVSLRRFLVDEQYLRRDTAGGSYERATTNLPYTFDGSIETLDLEELINEARIARELKKQQYMSKTED